MKTSKNYNFYTELLPKIIKWACQFEYNRSLPLLASGKDGDVTMTIQEIRFILANAFFLNTKYVSSGKRLRPYGDISFKMVYTSDFPIGAERILCQLSYFAQCDETEYKEERNIIFQRRRLSKSPKWSSSKEIVKSSIVQVRLEAMEESDAPVFVDFANKMLHIHRIIDSCTQEEVLFSCCPECFPAILICETLKPDEIVLIKGIRRFSSYRGYLMTFKFVDFFKTKNYRFDTLAIDSCIGANIQWKGSNIDRDLNKAYLGFINCDKKKISTGHWGCGAFGGNKTLKFLQQLMAATATGVSLDYSVFKDRKCAEDFKELLAIMDKKNVTVKQLYKIIKEKEKKSGDVKFEKYIRDAINK